MKLCYSKFAATLLVAARCVVGIIRTEELLASGVVQVTFSDFTNTAALLNAADTSELQQRSALAKHVECIDVKTYWDYWWYGAGPVLVCGDGQNCVAVKGEGLRIDLSISGSGGMEASQLITYSFGFQSSYHWESSVTTYLKQDIHWTGPAQYRMWLKQWFAVTEASCQTCYGPNCNDWAPSKGWMPCRDDDCYQYSVSDAYARDNYSCYVIPTHIRSGSCCCDYRPGADAARNMRRQLCPSCPSIRGYFCWHHINASPVSAAITVNSSVAKSDWNNAATISHCNITLAYTHNCIDDDIVHVSYWVPAPSDFRKRYFSTGRGGLAINSGRHYVPVESSMALFLASPMEASDPTISCRIAFSCWLMERSTGSQCTCLATRRTKSIGKQLTARLYNVSKNETLYSYYLGCSEGGREVWSQRQRFADQFDGAVIGAPALRYSQQQANHLTSNVVEQTLGYYPPTCELAAIVNLAIAACESLDGQTDGVLARSDLCKLNLNVSSTVGKASSCAATTPRAMGGISIGAANPAQNGIITAKGAAVAATILDGRHDSDGKFVYLSYRPGAAFSDAATTYDSATGSWMFLVASRFACFLELQNTSSLTTLANYTQMASSRARTHGRLCGLIACTNTMLNMND
ncbi:hypothetical protein LLEC1_03819 [Akanthomyces lecanii]|uniref:Carboxylic ester hydrolase n=1 Tax=Cordyceps confragosa TaxID=2714763 RepID=A0A179IHT9_CORDF|nr:hypothetical protein LLEC1_03819 [Akanthomyces lecanii]